MFASKLEVSDFLNIRGNSIKKNRIGPNDQQKLAVNHSNKGHFFNHLAQYKHKKGYVFYIFIAEIQK